MNTTPTLEMLDPETLAIDVNVRKDAALTPGLRGQHQGTRCPRASDCSGKDDGTVHVLMGQHRTCAAVEAERPEIPVMVTESPGEAERVLT